MARLSFLFVALALASMHGALGAPSCKPKWHGHSMVSHSSFSSLAGEFAQPTTYPVGTPKESGVSDSNSGTPTPSPTSPPATQPMPTSTPSVAPSSSQPASLKPSSGTVSNTDIDAYLKAHNDFRNLHGAQPLTWSSELSATAQAWANGCKFVHSHGQYGENLAAGSGALSIQDAITMWTDEGKTYDPTNPVPSHFTQVVWKGSTQLGCAFATCPAGSIFPANYGPAVYHVCEYNPPGNVIGEFAQNVQV